MNFNYSRKPEYNLFERLIDEQIRLYGVPCKYIKAKKINPDEIYGEHSHIRLEKDKVFEIYIYPSEAESWTDSGFFLNNFGVQNQETFTGFISKRTMEFIHPDIVNLKGLGYDDILGNLILFDSGRFMEITHIDPYESGNSSNLFAFGDSKNSYKISMKQYIYNTDELLEEKDEPESDIEVKNFEELEEIFGISGLDKENNEKIQEEAEKPLMHQKQKIKGVRDNVFGDLG